MNKKAALELSINAIVVIVIAMAVLGLGLGFVRSQIKKMTETTSAVQEQVKQQILDDLRTGDKKLSLQSSEITIGKGDSTVLGFGIKNTENAKLTIGLNITAIPGQEKNVGSFEYDARIVYELSPTDADVFSARLTAGTESGTTMYEVTVYSGDLTSPIVYAKKTFFVTVPG